MVYGLGTLRHPHMQATFERMGWQLIGITSRVRPERVVAPGVVKRVYEAVYAKVLVPEELLRPRDAGSDACGEGAVRSTVSGPVP